MITTVDSGKEILNVTQGQLIDDCCHFISDNSLIGLTLNVDFGLFVDTPLNTAKLSPGFSIVYPFAVGTYPLTFAGIPELFKNLSANITVISATEFVIEFRIINVADINNYIQLGTIPNNYQYWIDKSVGNGTNVYDQFKYLDVKVTVQFPDTLVTGSSSILYKAKKWQNNPSYYLYTNYFSLGAKKVQGWRSGEDLTVWFDTPGSLVNSKWHGGIFNVKSNNALAFWDDLKLQYAELGDIPVSAEPNFENSKIIASCGLYIENTNYFNGYFTIDKSYFVAGETYRLFFIWQDNSEWYSSLSENIQEEIVNDVPEIIGDVTFDFTIKEPSDLLINSQCISNLAPCQRVESCITIDIPSFNADMIANGLPYTFDEVYGGFGSITNMQGDILIYVTDNLQVNSPDIFSNFTTKTYVYDNGVSFKACVTFDIPEDWAGTNKYIFFKFKLILPTSQVFYPIIPVSLSIVDFGVLPTIIGTVEPFYCDNIEALFCFDATTDSSNMIVKYGNKTLLESGLGTNESSFIDSDGCMTIDYSFIDYDQDEICFCIISQFGEGETMDACPCDEMKVDITFVGIPYDVYNQKMTFNWDLSHFVMDSEVASVLAAFPVGGYQEFNKASGSFTLIVNVWTTTVIYFIITLANGCAYYTNYRVTKSSRKGSVLLCDDPIPPPLLGLPCAEFPYLDTICTITEAESVLNLAGGAVVEHKYTFDIDLGVWLDYTIPVTFGTNEKVHFYAIVSPSDTVRCDDKIVYSEITAASCEACYDPIPVNPCEGYLTITESYDEITQLLELTTVIDPGCGAPDDTELMYSFTGLGEYFIYSAPIDTTGYNYVYYYRTLLCGDGCKVQANGKWERECKYDPCTDEGAVGACDVSITHEIIIAGFSTDHYNPDLGTGIQSFDSHFYSLAPYGDRTVIESRIRVDILDDTAPGYIANSCYFIRQGFYESQYFNKAATNLQTGGIITNIRMFRFIAATNSLTAYNLDCSSIVFAGNGSTFATALKNFIIADLTAAFAYTNGTHYRLVVNCTNAGVFTITFDFKDATDGTDWLGINKLDATISFDRDGATLPVTLTQATIAPDVQGCPKYLLLDSLDCNYNTPCSAPMKFRAAPDGDLDCGADFAYISDSNQFNFHSIPLGPEPYTVDPVSTLTESCNKHRLIGDTENFIGAITYEWKDSNGDIVTTSRMFDTYEIDTYTFKATGSGGCIVSKAINIGI